MRITSPTRVRVTKESRLVAIRCIVGEAIDDFSFFSLKIIDCSESESVEQCRFLAISRSFWIDAIIQLLFLLRALAFEQWKRQRSQYYSTAVYSYNTHDGREYNIHSNNYYKTYYKGRVAWRRGAEINRYHSAVSDARQHISLQILAWQ
jgi:hypothetical protein